MDKGLEAAGWREVEILGEMEAQCWECGKKWRGKLMWIEHEVRGRVQRFEPDICECGVRWDIKRKVKRRRK